MWAVGRYDLKLSEEEFWGLTLKEFGLLVERYNAEIEREDFRVGLICSVLANIYRDERKRSKPFTPQDFMPSCEPRETVNEGDKEELDYLLELAKNLGAEVIVNG